MKRTNEDGGAAPCAKKQRAPDMCAICRSELADKCFMCVASETIDTKRVCQGSVTSAVCGHAFHTECIARWLDTRPCCPLCNATWVFPWGLSLKQLAAVKFIDNEEKMIELAADDLDPSIFVALGHAVRTTTPSKTLPRVKQRFLAQTFGHYLEVSELEELLAAKKPAMQPKRVVESTD